MFEIDADIRKAKTLSSDFYTDERFFELSREKIFAKAWHFLGRPEEVESLKPLTLLRGFLDEPVLLSRFEGNVVCLSNVCTHRGKILVEEQCKANLIRCGYHGRRFSLDGHFLSMPEFAGVEDFPSDSDNLRQLTTAEWKGFLFASKDPYAQLMEAVSTADAFAYEQLKLTSTKSYEVDGPCTQRIILRAFTFRTFISL
jgi:choline monooxygenase